MDSACPGVYARMDVEKEKCCCA
uniref:Uncharacterized protein n=1 Tax=Anguilla anguilla TaxID=7936 RepID=A0A0E9UGA5_ANGAN